MKRILGLMGIGLLVVGCAGRSDHRGGVAPKGDLGGQPVAPTFAAVELRLDPDGADYSGSVRIELEVEDPVASLRFHAMEMTVERAVLRGDADARDLVLEEGEDGLVVASADGEIAPGSYALEIDFSNEYDTQAVGLYRMEHGGRGYLFTQFQAVDARKAFPCWDEPAFKIPFQLTIQIPERHEAVTNTPVESETAAEGWKTLVFARTRPLPSYLLAIAVGPLESVPITGLSVPGRIYTVAGQSHLTAPAVELTPPILEALERYFGRPYPYAKLDLVAVPEFWPGAMENAGLVTYADQILLIDPKAASVEQRRRLASITAHELAHMWFGDLVTIRWWDDLWLNESFADWMGDKITQELFPEYKVNVAGLRSVQSIMVSDARPSTNPIRKPVDSPAEMLEGVGLAYAKGESVLGMIEQWLGAEAFRLGVIDYVDSHAWGSAEAADLWRALEESSDRDVSSPLSSFLDQAGYPMINVDVGARGVLKLSQQRFLNHGVDAPRQLWTVPIQLKYSDGEEIRTRTLLLERESQEIDLATEIDWVMPNAGAHGYYRWRVPSNMLLQLADNAGETMDPRERIAFLGNAGALLDSGVIGGDDYLKILNAFAEDPDPDVVSSLLAGLGKVQLSFVPDELLEPFAVYVRQTLRPALDRFGLERREGEDEAATLFRPRLFDWLGTEGRDREVRRQAASMARAYMQDPASVDPSLAGVALRIAAIDGDRSLFERYRRGFEGARAPVERALFLSALGAFTDPRLQEEALTYAVEGPVRPTEIFQLAGSLPQTAAGRDSAYRWVTDHYGAITSKLPAEFASYMPMIASGCSEERLADAREFFTSPEHSVDGTEARLAKVADQVMDCVNLRRREGAAVADYLARLEPQKGS